MRIPHLLQKAAPFCLTLSLTVSLLTIPLLSCRAADSTETNRKPDAPVLRQVAESVLRLTSRKLVDRSSDELFEDSADLPLKPEISIESKFNAWFYQTWLLTDGMRRTALALNDPKFANYGEQNLEFINRHLSYFQKQVDAKMKAAPVGDGALSPIGLYFGVKDLWHTGLAPLVLEQKAAHHDTRHDGYLKRIDHLLANEPTFDDGTFYRGKKGLMTDDPYMCVPYLIRRWKQSGNPNDLEIAIQQILGTHKRVFDSEKGLLSHLWDLKTEQPSGMFWGRGNGWVVLAHVELLANIPKDHPRRGELLSVFVRHMDGLRRFQDADGGWHQVIDHPESWIETSCTGMFTYGIARGVNEGWLDASFADVARKGWRALEQKVTPDGDVLDVCGSTDTGDLKFYLNRPRLKGDLHGFGSILLAGAEVQLLKP
ncbi:MAG: glycoside hydrolase family 88 protein [Verrucomicrobiota bacterium]